MHTEENILTAMRRLGFVLTPLVNIGYHFEYRDHDCFLCSDDIRNNVFKIISPIITPFDIRENHTVHSLINEANNIKNLTTVTVIDTDTIWVSYRSHVFGNEPLNEMLEIAINAVTSTAEYIQNGLKSIL